MLCFKAIDNAISGVKHVTFSELWLRMSSLELWLGITNEHEELLSCGSVGMLHPTRLNSSRLLARLRPTKLSGRSDPSGLSGTFVSSGTLGKSMSMVLGIQVETPYVKPNKWVDPTWQGHRAGRYRLGRRTGRARLGQFDQCLSSSPPGRCGLSSLTDLFELSSMADQYVSSGHPGPSRSSGPPDRLCCQVFVKSIEFKVREAIIDDHSG
ncbi:hypothetical protein DEO72_LG9g921 [Vigna unguiculata]|uniref:Uncharacterized protein n=1 Tax=Vigna unguiculata TaxID=3917 RepID=A0A4D6MZ18_VIGUN|nr:hypothetical protein DEO72_LG9g921 [Vigna unguiculata]